MDEQHAQHGYRVRLEWGLDGVSLLGPHSAALVIVDVLSFSTMVDVAVSRGASVLPLRWRDERAAAAAAAAGAVLAGNNEARWSLSPSTLADLPAGTRFAVPSPNGATLSDLAAAHGVPVIAGSLRNASAVAAAAHHSTAAGHTVISVIPAGERWPPHHTGPLRPAVEDLIGAGAVVDALRALGVGPASPEAMAAADAFTAAADRGLLTALTGCASGRELVERGRGDDVAIAARHDASGVAPIMVDGEYRAAGAG